MANYQLLKADIDKKVYQNGKQEITGANLNSVLNAMVTTLGAEYQFAGVATTATNPGTPDAKVFYIANGKGTYTNFGGLEVTEDEVVVLYWDTAWHKEATGIASQEKLTELGQDVDKIGLRSVNGPFDLCFLDENHNGIVYFRNGHIVTQKFNSEKIDKYILPYSGELLVRENTSVNTNGEYVTESGKYASNKFSIKNAVEVILPNSLSACVYYDDYCVKYGAGTNKICVIGANSIVIIGKSLTADFQVTYYSPDDIDLSYCPYFFRIPVNQNRINLSGSDLQPTTENIQYPLAVCYFSKDTKSKKTILLFGGLGKALTVNGWKSTTDGFETFIGELQNTFNVVCVEGGRPVTNNDIYRSDIDGYVMPSLGNPLIMSAMNKAHNHVVSQFGLNEDVAVVGCSQGGIAALNYNYLFGNVKTIVLCGGLAQLELDGWDRQPEDVQAYFNEWYGISQYNAQAVRGYDPYVKIQSIGGNNKLLNFPPLKCIYGSEDSIAPYQNVMPFIDAVNNGNGIAYIHIIQGGTHTTIAGMDDASARSEAIIWIKRFV